jgi:GNAT superfamily N-acetyltransferase
MFVSLLYYPITINGVTQVFTDRDTDLHMLHTDPEYQGQGAGGALMEWGKQKADELGLPTYLESSAKGHRFYQKHGFKDVQVMTMDLSQYGGTGTHEQPLMIREPSTSQ